MANSNNNARQTHVSPGIYTKEVDLNYASKSLGITTLGVAGETVKGPAFQPILIDSWRSYQTYFGGTSTKKFKGSQYPKYELPYIAKTYLEQSQQLQVCRVLGLSGVNAGAAWVISAYSTTPEDTSLGYTKDKPVVIAVIRSRGEHKKAAFLRNPTGEDKKKGYCDDIYEYDKLVYYAKSIALKPSKSLSLNPTCDPTYGTEPGDFTINSVNYGTFTIEVTTNTDEVKNYAVTFNPNEKNYITNVIGTDPEDGEAEIYVEELYDVALKQLIERCEIDMLKQEVGHFPVVRVIPSHKAVTDLLTEDESMLKRSYVGNRYLYSASESVNNENGNPLKVHVSTNKGKSWGEPVNGEPGHIYTVVAFTTKDGTREYYYGEYQGTDDTKNYKTEQLGEPTVEDEVCEEAVDCFADGMRYVYDSAKKDVFPITLDLNNYKEEYRYASTPWIVSEMKGSAEHVELNKLFRFNTISDGNSSNIECKVSIENIDPENGTFDVLVRSFSDTDNDKTILEKYSGVNLIPGSENYIAYRIGSTDESYETKSDYITVEVNETEKTKVSIPAGFLGYPVRYYDGRCVMGTETQPTLAKPYLEYNTNVDEDVRINRQYFGLSDLVGIDEDVLSYKGVEAYNNIPQSLTPCFHLDSRIFNGTPDENGMVEENGIEQVVSVDGVTGYQWVTVGKGNTTSMGVEPRIGDDETMQNTIYEDKRYRKFTVAFYGGFDGWDYYRTSRSIGDDFIYRKYRGNLNTTSGHGASFDVITNPEAYGFDSTEKVLTSDWYAYLSAIRQFANPSNIDINVLATPGIDYVNNKMLVDEVIDMVENERADSVYVVTTPDKPFGAADGESNMYTPEEAVDNLEDSDIDSNYTCTYYPWVKTFDSDNNQYIYLPITKDVVKNFAYTDNTAYPWFAAAGYNRGILNGVKPRKTLKLADQDELYGGRINFINKFATEGMRVWGDKNLQVNESQMNRISKRRLLLRIRKLLSIACIGLIFDPNDNTTVSSFKTAVDPILEDIRSKRGITDYRIEVDSSQEARDRLELPAKIYLKLQPNLEYIDISFIITPSGANFDDL